MDYIELLKVKMAFWNEYSILESTELMANCRFAVLKRSYNVQLFKPYVAVSWLQISSGPNLLKPINFSRLTFPLVHTYVVHTNRLINFVFDCISLLMRLFVCIFYSKLYIPSMTQHLTHSVASLPLGPKPTTSPLKSFYVLRSVE